MGQRRFAGVAILAVYSIPGVASGAIGYKCVAAMNAHPLAMQILRSAHRTGNCRLIHRINSVCVKAVEVILKVW